MPSMSKRESVARLEHLITDIGADEWKDAGDPGFVKWRRDTSTAIRYIFGEDSEQLQEFRRVDYHGVITVGGGPRDHRPDLLRGLERAIALIHSMIDEIRNYWPDESVGAEVTSQHFGTTSRQVFLVHGQDDAVKQSVARYIERLGLRATILHDQPNKGRTLIEKFEGCSQVGYAIVLLTPEYGWQSGR